MAYNQRGPPPQVPPPWRAIWDQRDNCYIYENEQTGQRQKYPPAPQGSGGYPPQHTGPPPPGGYGQPPRGGPGGYPPPPGPPSGYGQPPSQQYGSGPPGGYGRPPPQGYTGSPGGPGGYGPPPPQTHAGGPPQQAAKSSQGHNYGQMALAGAGGLVAGALLMHEGEKVHRDYDELKYGAEGRIHRAEYDVEEFPENAARWTGERVGGIERFGDRERYEYDQGRDDARYGGGYEERRFEEARDEARWDEERRDERFYEEGRDEARWDEERRDERIYEEGREEARWDEDRREDIAYEEGRDDVIYDDERRDEIIDDGREEVFEEEVIEDRW